MNSRLQNRQMNFFLRRLLTGFLLSAALGERSSSTTMVVVSSSQHECSCSSGSVADLARFAKSKRFFFDSDFCNLRSRICDCGGGVAVPTEHDDEEDDAEGVCGGVRSPGERLDDATECDGEKVFGRYGDGAREKEEKRKQSLIRLKLPENDDQQVKEREKEGGRERMRIQHHKCEVFRLLTNGQRSKGMIL